MGTAKKRHASKSPVKSFATKRHRQCSNSAQKLPLRGSKSQERTSTVNAPTDDATFRVKVISTLAELDSDVFKDAVTGLIRIFQPEKPILDAIEKEMRDQNAPQRNLDKMTKIVQTQIMHDMITAVAEQLDTANKVAECVKALVEASVAIHGYTMPEGLLDQVIPGLEYRDNDTSSDTREGDTGDEVATTDQQDEEVESSHEGLSVNTVTRPENPLMSIESGESLLIENTTWKDKSISKSYRWDIEIEDYDYQSVEVDFQRTADLFAYHALPIARARLGSSLTRNDMRREMRNMLDEMPATEFAKWVQSRDKLQKGDRTMLTRPEATSREGRRHITANTPAPIEFQSKSKGKGNAGAGSHGQSEGERSMVREPVPTEPRIKLEMRTDLGQTETPTVDQEDEVPGEGPEAAMPVRHPSFGGAHPDTIQDKHLVGSEPHENAKVAPLARLDNHAGNIFDHEQSEYFVQGESETPMIDLLWGMGPFAGASPHDIVKRILDSFRLRCGFHTTNFPSSDATSQREALGNLRNVLIRSYSIVPIAPYVTERMHMDSKLMCWGIRNLQRFPEILTHSYVFVHTMPSNHCVIRLLVGHDYERLKRSGGGFTLTATIMQRLKERNISGMLTREHFEKSIEHTLRYAHPQGKLEMILRKVAFANKSKFADLKASPPVKAWTEATGLPWC